MRDSGMDLFDPRTTVLDSDFTSSPSESRDQDFGFAFNASNFSNQVLLVEIIADSIEAMLKSEGCKTLIDWALRKSKRCRGDIAKKENAASVASSIQYHAEFTPLFSPENFEPPKAFFATAQSVRDALIINWNATICPRNFYRSWNDFHEKMNVKQAYYLSMDFLQGRVLLNAIGNLELTGGYAEALEKLGHTLESVASQIGNPWEIARNDVTYPVKFYGKVVTRSDGKRSWIGGEDIVVVSHDVPIPGYKTKTTINLRLWSTRRGLEIL